MKSSTSRVDSRLGLVVRAQAHAAPSLERDLWIREFVRPVIGRLLAGRARLGCDGVFVGSAATQAEKDEVRRYEELLDLGGLLEGTTSKEDAQFSKPSPASSQRTQFTTRASTSHLLAMARTASIQCQSFP